VSKYVTTTILALVLFASFAGAAAAAEDVRLVVHRGDDVTAMLTRLVGADGVTRVLEHNGLSAGSAPAPGQELRVPASWLIDVAQSTAELLFVRGDVTIRGKGGASLPAGVGARMEAGDLLITGADGSATVRLIGADQSVDHDHMFVEAGSEVEVAQLLVTEDKGWRASLVRLLKGAVEVVTSGSAESRKQIEVETPTAIGGVRGTEFRVAVEEAAGDQPLSTRVETLDGQVMTAAAGAEVTVGEGFGSRARMGEAPEAPRPLPATPVALEPFDGAALTAFVFRWEPVEGATAYVVEIATDDEFLRIDQRVRVDGTELAPADASLPRQDAPLRWRVSAVDADGFRGPASTPRAFTVAAG